MTMKIVLYLAGEQTSRGQLAKIFTRRASHNNNNNLFLLLTDLQKGPPSHKGITENTAIIAGVVAALVLLVALTLLAVYYINTHPTVAPPFYLMQVRKTHSCAPSRQHFIVLPTDASHARSCSSAARPLATPVCCS